MKVKKQQVKLVCLRDSKSHTAEAFRTLRTNIQFSGLNSEIKKLLVTSAGPGEGKTTTVTNLALVFAETGKRVILIDGDLRKPNIHRAFNISNRFGLTNFLLGTHSLKEVVQVLPYSELEVLTAGTVPPNPAEILGSLQMKSLIEKLEEIYDLVLIDSPPVLPVTDSQVLTRFVDGVLLVLRAGKVMTEDAKKAKVLLERVGGRVIGTVLNGKKIRRKGSYEYYAHQ